MAKKPARTGMARRSSTRLLAFTLLLLLAITGGAAAVVLPEQFAPLRAQVAASFAEVMAACEHNEKLFPKKAPATEKRTPPERWRATYKKTIEAVLEEHLRRDERKLVCDAKEPFMEASPPLKEIAKELMPWKTGDAPHEEDMAQVLLEYTRAYECTLKERNDALSSQIRQELKQGAGYAEYVRDKVTGAFKLASLTLHVSKQRKVIHEELKLARPAMDRTLRYLAGQDRLRPLDNGLRCFERASLEVRNIMGLTADVSSCLPRIWESRNPLRDLGTPAQ